MLCLSFRTTFFMTENKYYTPVNFFLPFAYIMILGFFFTESNDTIYDLTVIKVFHILFWQGHKEATLTNFHIIISPPWKGWETYCFSLCVCLCPSVYLSVTKSCLLYNLITVRDISTKLLTFCKAHSDNVSCTRTILLACMQIIFLVT